MTESDISSESGSAGWPEQVAVRRKDRAVSDEAWIEEMLIQSATGVLATSRDGQPFVNMNVFVYNPAEKCIYLHTASEGQTRTNVEQNERVCFSQADARSPAMDSNELLTCRRRQTGLSAHSH